VKLCIEKCLEGGLSKRGEGTDEGKVLVLFSTVASCIFHVRGLE